MPRVGRWFQCDVQWRHKWYHLFRGGKDEWKSHPQPSPSTARSETSYFKHTAPSLGLHFYSLPVPAAIHIWTKVFWKWKKKGFFMSLHFSEKRGVRKKKKKEKKNDCHRAESVTGMKWTVEYSGGIGVLDSSVLCRLQHSQQLVTASSGSSTTKPTESGSVTHPAQLLFTEARALDSNH